MRRDVCRPQLDLTVQNSKQNNAWEWWKQEVSQLSDCHLAVCWSSGNYHTSSERGHSELSTDMKIRTIVQLIGILWSYFGVYLGSANHLLHFDLSLCNLLAHIRLPYIRWKGTSIALILAIVASPIPSIYRDMVLVKDLVNPPSYFKLSCHTYWDPHSSRPAETIPKAKPRMESTTAILLKMEPQTGRVAHP